MAVDGVRDGSRIDPSLATTTAAEAAASVDADATVATSGFGRVGYPKAVPVALADDDVDRSLTVVSGGSVGDEIDTALVESGDLARRHPFVAVEAARDAINAGDVAFADRHIAGLADDVATGRFGDVDVAVVEAVAVGEDWLVPSTSLGATPAFVAAADELIVEVNDAQPLALCDVHDVYRRDLPPDREPIPLAGPGDRIGTSHVSFDATKLAAVVRTDERDTPYRFRDATAADRAIADHLVTFLEAEVERNPVFAESLALQFGVGSVGNALMAGIEDADFGDRSLTYFGEVVQDGLLDLLDAGRLDAASATALALSERGQQRLFDDVERYAGDVLLRPAAVSNSPALVDRFGVIAVNSALAVDRTGHVNSTHLRGSHLVNGVGGSGDFTRNAAVSVIALPSTAGNGDVSRIVPEVAHVDHTEHDVDVVITDHGIADLRGLSPRERADAVTPIAAPSFRSELEAYDRTAREGGGHVPRDPNELLGWH
ncbi:MAG: acetyl-CoA hydrolase/transferase C-terminal domain-containing protein [Haloarculaceae archaeon]